MNSEFTIIIQARLGSRRFQKKVVEDIENKPVIWHVINRLKQVVGAKRTKELSSINIIDFNKYSGEYIIAGISSLDYMKLYKKFTYVFVLAI